MQCISSVIASSGKAQEVRSKCEGCQSDRDAARCLGAKRMVHGRARMLLQPCAHQPLVPLCRLSSYPVRFAFSLPGLERRLQYGAHGSANFLPQSVWLACRCDTAAYRPCDPSGWALFNAIYLHRGTCYEIDVVRRATDDAAGRVELDRALVSGMRIVLVDDGKTHFVVVRVAGATRRGRS
jgi:hypothetical protein